MKRRALFVICVSFILVANSFSQTQSQTDAFNKFWDLAVNNNFESAKSQIASNISDINNLEKIRQNFQIVSANKLKLLDFWLNRISLNKAFFTVTTNDENKQEVSFQLTMIKLNESWKILAFDKSIQVVVDGGDIPINVPPNSYQPFGQNRQQTNPPIILLETYNPAKNPVEFIGKPYYPNQNMLQFNKFVPKPK